MDIDGQGARLVDEPGARGEARDPHGAAAAVTVSGTTVEHGQGAGISSAEEDRDEVRPICRETFQKFERSRYPEVQLLDREAGENGVLLENRDGGFRVAQAVDKRGEALLGCFTGQEILKPRNVELQDQSAAEAREEAERERLGGQPLRLGRGEQRDSSCAAPLDVVYAFPQPKARPVDQGADQREETHCGIATQLLGTRQRLEALRSGLREGLGPG